MLGYLRVSDGGLKDEYLLDYNYALLKVRNYECDAKVGGDTREEEQYRGMREF